MIDENILPEIIIQKCPRQVPTYFAFYYEIIDSGTLNFTFRELSNISVSKLYIINRNDLLPYSIKNPWSQIRSKTKENRRHT